MWMRDMAGPQAIAIDTEGYGKLYVSFAQALRVLPEDKEWRLITERYWYRIQRAPGMREQALIRWEYDRTLAAGKRHCRHHVQQAGDLAFGDGLLDLNKAHLPTGWVTIEEVLRFLIVDLRIAPPCGEEWADVLEESERAFHEEFSDSRYVPPREGSSTPD